MKAFLHVLETRLLRRPGWLPIPAAPAIRVADTGFTVHGLSVRWDAVTHIAARRGGRYADICLDVGTDAADGKTRLLTLSESQRGFDAFVAMADRKMTFPLAWWDQLAGPAARRQGLRLFERRRQD